MNINHNDDLCLALNYDDLWIWHKRFCHINFVYIKKLTKNNLLRGLPKINFKVKNLCDACQLGK